jgi:hypothetical protein
VRERSSNEGAIGYVIVRPLRSGGAMKSFVRELLKWPARAGRFLARLVHHTLACFVWVSLVLHVVFLWSEPL